MRNIVKQIGRAVAHVCVTPAVLSFWLRGALIGRDRALEGSSQAFALVPGLVGQYLRRAFLAHALARCHYTATIEFGALFSRTEATLDENVYVGPRCHLGLVHLERDVLLGPAVQIPSGGKTHGSSSLDVAIRDQPGVRTMVTIGAGSWVGGGAVIMADVGRDSIVGAGAVVTSALPDRVVAGGVPARILKQRR